MKDYPREARKFIISTAIAPVAQKDRASDF